MTIKKSGFTIFEIIVMMFILVAVSAVFMKWTSNRQLLNSSKIYADQSYNYAMMYIKYWLYMCFRVLTKAGNFVR